MFTPKPGKASWSWSLTSSKRHPVKTCARESKAAFTIGGVFSTISKHVTCDPMGNALNKPLPSAVFLIRGEIKLNFSGNCRVTLSFFSQPRDESGHTLGTKWGKQNMEDRVEVKHLAILKIYNMLIQKYFITSIPMLKFKQLFWNFCLRSYNEGKPPHHHHTYINLYFVYITDKSNL